MQASKFEPGGIPYEMEQYKIQNGKVVSWFKDIISLTGQARSEDSTTAKRDIRGALDVLKSLRPSSDYDFAERIEFCKRWFDIVSAYIEGALTRQTDKLIALSGVAELVQRRAQAPYLAGYGKPVFWNSSFSESSGSRWKSSRYTALRRGHGQCQGGCEGSRGHGAGTGGRLCRDHGIPINLKLRRGERERMPAACQAQEI